MGDVQGSSPCCVEDQSIQIEGATFLLKRSPFEEMPPGPIETMSQYACFNEKNRVFIYEQKQGNEEACLFLLLGMLWTGKNNECAFFLAGHSAAEDSIDEAGLKILIEPKHILKCLEVVIKKVDMSFQLSSLKRIFFYACYDMPQSVDLASNKVYNKFGECIRGQAPACDRLFSQHYACAEQRFPGTALVVYQQRSGKELKKVEGKLLSGHYFWLYVLDSADERYNHLFV